MKKNNKKVGLSCEKEDSLKKAEHWNIKKESTKLKKRKKATKKRNDKKSMENYRK